MMAEKSVCRARTAKYIYINNKNIINGIKNGTLGNFIMEAIQQKTMNTDIFT